MLYNNLIFSDIAPANLVPRRLSSDIAVNVQRPAPQTLHLRAGSFLLFDLIGMCASLLGYRRPSICSSIVFIIITSKLVWNPNSFSEPEIFRPSRWEGVSEHDVGQFGFGPRACIG